MNRMQPKTPNSPTVHAGDVLTITESCQLLKIGTAKLRELISSGSLDVVRLGYRTVRVKRASIDRLLGNGL
jgi:excisionase family DNA binding protein